MIDWHNIEYLAKGNIKQQQCYRILIEHKILEKLRSFNPIIIGTIPIEIDTEESDIDIACQSDNLLSFRESIQKQFSSYPFFSENLQDNSYSASFYVENIPVEIYTERVPVKEQNGYKHMVIENRILNMAGKIFKNNIVELKKKGYKTEPAFGKLLNMKNAYTELLLLDRLNDSELEKVLNNIIEK